MTTATSHPALLLRNFRLANGVERAANLFLQISEGKISKLTKAEISAPLEIDLKGNTLLPGFIDVHIHGANGVDVLDASPDDLLRVARFLATQGVTGWLPTLVPAPDDHFARAASAIEQAMKLQALIAAGAAPAGQAPGAIGARILGVHYEGPFVNSAQCGALRREYFRRYQQPNDASLPVPKKGIKMITVAPEIEGGLDLVATLVARGWLVALGHTRANPSVLDAAFQAGARHLTHFMNAMPPMHHREPGPIGWALGREDVTCDLIADGVHLDPLILRLLMKLVTPDRLLLISDAIAATGMGEGDFQIWGQTIAVEGRKTRNSHGSIAGSVITMREAVMTMLGLGANTADVARMAATNPARLLQLDKLCGSIKEGMRADLVALTDAGSVSVVLVGGLVQENI